MVSIRHCEREREREREGRPLLHSYLFSLVAGSLAARPKKIPYSHYIIRVILLFVTGD